MKKHITIYSISWVLMLAVFNFVSFMTVGFAYGTAYFNGPFWIAYALVTLAFVGNLLITLYAVGKRALSGIFLRLSLIRIGYIATVVCTLVGMLFMALAKFLPAWIGGVIAVLVFGFYVLSALRVILAVGAVEEVEKHTAVRTAAMRALLADASALLARTPDGALHVEVNRVYDAIRYSDTASTAALVAVEEQIRMAFTALVEAVSDGDEELVRVRAAEVVALVEERRTQAKVYK